MNVDSFIKGFASGIEKAAAKPFEGRERLKKLIKDTKSYKKAPGTSDPEMAAKGLSLSKSVIGRLFKSRPKVGK